MGVIAPQTSGEERFCSPCRRFIHDGSLLEGGPGKAAGAAGLEALAAAAAAAADAVIQGGSGSAGSFASPQAPPRPDVFTPIAGGQPAGDLGAFSGADDILRRRDMSSPAAAAGPSPAVRAGLLNPSPVLAHLEAPSPAVDAAAAGTRPGPKGSMCAMSQMPGHAPQQRLHKTTVETLQWTACMCRIEGNHAVADSISAYLASGRKALFVCNGRCRDLLIKGAKF